MKPLAVITGGSSGIGLATAHELLSTHSVISLSRRDATGIHTIPTDVSDPDAVAMAFALIATLYGIPDVLINNAGYVEPHGLLETSFEEWQRTQAVNMTGTFLCTQAYARLAKERGGKVINIASTAGTRPQPGWSAYAAAKAGVINFSLTMAEELRPYGIKVYCIAPGRCATPLRAKLAPDEDPAAIMQPDAVAKLIRQIVDDGNLLDGQVLFARGG